jgi:fatty acid desaturase
MSYWRRWLPGCACSWVRDGLVVQVPIAMLSGATGIWLFYVQHQFEDVYWESNERWSYLDRRCTAALTSS